MAAQVITPNEAARRLSKALGRVITPKQVRQYVRDTWKSYSKADHPERQSHGYTSAQYATLEREWRKRGTRTAPKVAPKGGTRKARTAARTRKATPVETPDGDA